MKPGIVKSPISYHNNIQLDYFGQKIKKTMIPVSSHYVKRHVDELTSFAGITRQHKVLDVGCGMGKFTLQMLEKGFNVSGLDLSPFLLQKLLEYNDNRFQIDLYASDILDAPEELNNQFDYVVGFFALHHFHQLHTCFQATKRLVKPGGKIVFTEPNAYNPLYYIQIFGTPGMSWKGDKGVANMRKSVIKKAAEYAGLENFQMTRFGFFPPFLANQPVGRKVEHVLENISVLKPIRPFQIFMVEKPE